MTRKPTPTQAEQDAHARGERVVLEPSGADPQWSAHPAEERPKEEKAAEVVEKTEPLPKLDPTKVVEAETRATEADHKRSTYRTRRAVADKDEKEDEK